jgi:hypothetical protein
MHKDDIKFGVFILLFIVFTFVNTIYLWLPASAPPVLLVLGLGAYSIWDHKRKS